MSVSGKGYKIGGKRGKEQTPFDLYLDNLVRVSLVEDIGSGDITTEFIIARGARGSAVILAKEDIIVAGIPVAERVFKAVDSDIRFEPLAMDGDKIRCGAHIARLSGRIRNILTAERTALNFLQRLSGIATMTKKLLLKMNSKDVKLLDTRKTTPCMRVLEKYAVRAGGGHNHRFGLFDGILIKDNHVDAVGCIGKAVKRARKKAADGMKVEVEARNLGEVEEAVKSGADIIMLDNMGISEIKKALKMIDKRAMVEVSGGVNLENIASIARAGVDFISVGGITHSARAVDITMKLVKK